MNKTYNSEYAITLDELPWNNWKMTIMKRKSWTALAILFFTAMNLVFFHLLQVRVSTVHLPKASCPQLWHWSDSGSVANDSFMATPHKERLAALHVIWLHLFRHISQKCSWIHKVFTALFVSSDEKSDGASDAQSLCGIALYPENLCKAGKLEKESVSAKCRYAFFVIGYFFCIVGQSFHFFPWTDAWSGSHFCSRTVQQSPEHAGQCA